MTAKQIPGSTYAPDGSLYITLTDGAGNLATAGASGPTGATGPTGVTGVTGATGPIGNTYTFHVYTVTTLPTPTTGMVALVSDATSNTVLGAGSGSAYCLAVYNGSTWVAV